MRKSIVYILLFLATLFPAAAFAGSGKAVVAFWSGSASTGQTSLTLTNITPHDLLVRVEFYNRQGTLITSAPPTIGYTNFTNSNTTVAARNTGTVSISSTVTDSNAVGLAVVYWENTGTDNDLYGLVGHGIRVFPTGTTRAEHYIPINNANPF